jgi:hypothetical protein
MNLTSCQPAGQDVLSQAGLIESVLDPIPDNEPPTKRCGYGACSVSGCYCKGYMGTADLCSNCGHAYPAHC